MGRYAAVNGNNTVLLQVSKSYSSIGTRQKTTSILRKKKRDMGQSSLVGRDSQSFFA